MKLLHTLCIWVAVCLGFLIFIQEPIVKLTTKKAMSAIEVSYLRQDMTDADKAHYQQLKAALLANRDIAHSRLAAARCLGFGVCLVLFIQSVVGLRRESRRTSPGALPNGGPPRSLSNSGGAGGPPSVS